MKIAFITSEIYPYSKTGGLGDVSGALPKALARSGCEVKIFTPKYSSIEDENLSPVLLKNTLLIQNRAIEFDLHKTELPDSGVEVYFIDAPEYFHRETIYTDDEDEDERFIFFNKAVLETIIKLKWKPDIIHVNDWQTALIPYYVKENYSNYRAFKKVKTLLTIHNIGYQGKFNKSALQKADIDEKYFYPAGPAEFYGDVNFLKLGIVFVDIINTVSRTYAEEILTSEFGAGLSGVLLTRRADIFGILNGIDDVWNPEKDKYIRKHYGINNLGDKRENKKQLAYEMGFEFIPEEPVIAMVSRMATQKGFDILMEILPDLFKEHAHWVVLGSGEVEYENFFREIEMEYPDKISVHIGYNDRLAHVIEAGADMFLMPSKYEPCGLNQMYSLKYGTVPVVRKTGGLADTVFDWDEMKRLGNYNGNGFSFENYNEFDLRDALLRAMNYFKFKNVWNVIQKNGMRMNFSWENSADKYITLYKHILKR